MLWRTRKTPPEDTLEAQLQQLQRSTALHIQQLNERVRDLERAAQDAEAAHVSRLADLHTLLDKLQRLYNRLIARIGRDGSEAQQGGPESPLELRQRLRGG